jgi:hypothetical protein
MWARAIGEFAIWQREAIIRLGISVSLYQKSKECSSHNYVFSSHKHTCSQSQAPVEDESRNLELAVAIIVSHHQQFESSNIKRSDMGIPNHVLLLGPSIDFPPQTTDGFPITINGSLTQVVCRVASSDE